MCSQSRPTLCKPIDCSLPGSSVHEILQARILEWVAIPFSRGSSWHRDWTQVFHIAGSFFTVWATREVRGWYQIIKHQITHPLGFLPSLGAGFWVSSRSQSFQYLGLGYPFLIKAPASLLSLVHNCPPRIQFSQTFLCVSCLQGRLCN